MTHSFQNNLKLLRKRNAKIALQLTHIDPSDLQFCHAENGELNLKRVYSDHTYYYHNQENPTHEAKVHFEGLSKKKIKTMFIYGIGLGYDYAAAYHWLKKDRERTLVFLEEDLSVLYRCFETELGGKILKDSQVQIHHFKDMDEDKTLFNELSWIFMNTPYLISFLSLYRQVNPEGCEKITHQIQFLIEEKRNVTEEYLKYGVSFFRNFYPNLLQLPHAYLGNALFNQFKNIPAIICGAGPSLNKQIDTLKSLNNRALIFAGSSSVNALIHHEIIPHFGVAVDPNKWQELRVQAAAPYGIPFFYRNRAYHGAVKAITGPKLYLTGTGGYPISRWYEEKLGIEGKDLDEGNNVVNFSIEIAAALGCHPIILIGVDLAFTNDAHYTEGVIENLQLDRDEFRLHKDRLEHEVLKVDIYGKPIYTLWKWIKESEWISNYAQEHPEIRLINSTEGGIGMGDVPNIPFEEAISTCETQDSSLYEYIAREVVNHPLVFPSDKIRSLMQEMKESLARCINLLTGLIQETHQLMDLILVHQAYPETLETRKTSLIETDLQNEDAYVFLLDIFNQIFIRCHHREIQKLQSPCRGLSQQRRDLKKLRLQEQRLSFLRDVCRLNIELIFRTLQGEVIG